MPRTKHSDVRDSLPPTSICSQELHKIFETKINHIQAHNYAKILQRVWLQPIVYEIIGSIHILQIRITHVKNMTWRFIDTDMTDGYYSAALFESIAKHVGSGEVDNTIFFWRAKTPAVYLGYHQYVEDEVHEDYCAANGIQVVRRVLGGGCGFCDEDQILFSVIASEGGGAVPADIQGAYSRILSGLINTLRMLGFDGKLEPKRNAVYSQGRKISGNAQGRFEGAVLFCVNDVMVLTK